MLVTYPNNNISMAKDIYLTRNTLHERVIGVRKDHYFMMWPCALYVLLQIMHSSIAPAPLGIKQVLRKRRVAALQ